VTVHRYLDGDGFRSGKPGRLDREYGHGGTHAQSDSGSESSASDRGGHGSEHKKIAIVEDEQALSSIYSLFLEGLGYNAIFVAMSGEEMVRGMVDRKASPDLVVMDYRLPGMNGIETAKRMKELKPAIKVIITTADDSVKAEAMSLGFSFLQKPFALRALSETIDQDLRF
jgi:DNA-binding NtrC family response regulator